MKEVTLFDGRKRLINETFMATVDPARFKALLKERGLKQMEINQKIGYASNSVASALANGVFSGQMVQGLKNYFGIQPEDYEYKQPEEKPAKPETLAVEESALYATMKAAMLDALNEAFSGNFRGMVMDAVREAFESA